MQTHDTIYSYQILFWRLAVAFALLVTSTPAWSAADNAIFGQLLTKYNRDGWVDYAGFKAEEDRLDDYLNILAEVDPAAMGQGEQFAFYVNAYNAWTIKLILSGYPGVGSIKDLGSLFKSPWKKKFVRLKGQTVTLDHIEHDILRPGFKDPRVHFAVNCASKGCPPLLEQPFTGSRLDEQLNFATRRFVNEPRFNRLEGNTLYVSRIFKWFGEDFNHDIIGFFKQHAEGELKRGLNAGMAGIDIEYLDYDWSLNGE